MAKYPDAFVSNINAMNLELKVKIDPEVKEKAIQFIQKRFPEKEIHEEFLEILDLKDLKEAI